MVAALLAHLNPQKSREPTLGGTNDQLSWQDPQVFLKASCERGDDKFYDICDFVKGHLPVQEDVVLNSVGGHKVVLKTGPAKPKLENLSIHQWSVASICILYKLIQDQKLQNIQDILDYQSYTIRVHQ